MMIAQTVLLKSTANHMFEVLLINLVLAKIISII